MLRNLSLDNPRWPFSLVFVFPVFTALAGFAFLTAMPQCGGDEPWWEEKHVRLAFLPGILNLAPLAWLFSKSLPARQAGGIAGIMGTVETALAYGSRSGRLDRRPVQYRFCLLATVAGA